MVKISCIVPVYNVEKYIHRCIDSILTQTFTDFELILIDDGSPDNSGLICDEYAKKDNRVKVIHQENKGSAGARNVGIENAIGQYISFVDSDDWLEKNYFECFYEELKRTDADIVGCDLVNEYENQNIICLNPFPRTSKDCIHLLLEEKLKSYLHTKLFKKNLFEKNDCFFVEEFDLHEDMLICIKLFYYAEKTSYINKSLYHYNRYNENSLTNLLNENKVKQIVQVDSEIEKFLQYKNLSESYHEILKKRKALSKIWILSKCETLKTYYMKIYVNEKLSSLRNISSKWRVIFLLCECKFFTFAKILVKLRRFV